MNPQRIVIVGGGAAGFFAAIACAESPGGAEILILEKTSQFLSKVRISGGGRCNVTHADFDGREFSKRFPRGERALISAFGKFQASDTVAWFEDRGVKLKIENDGRMFPTTDSSQTIIDCLLNAAEKAGIKLRANCGAESAFKKYGGGFELTLSSGEKLVCDKLLLAIGGCRTPALGQLAVSLGHTLEPPVPSLFTFHVEIPWLRELAGISVENVEASIPETKLRERGAILLTHWGLSGPTILRLSAWGARELHAKNYQFKLQINWLPQLGEDKLMAEFQTRRKSQPAKLIVNFPIAPLPARLWEQLVLTSGVAREIRWSELSGATQHNLIQQLLRSEFPVTGKSLNKDEFVTCGGVKLSEVNFKTMESKVCLGLFFAGEVLDIDGITGGYNFQAAWTTGWIAGRAMAGD
ncbi:MAG TPA: NAD(P)/FAD-dependent oxidoreductase [Verrucomicrobiae bacterium]